MNKIERLLQLQGVVQECFNNQTDREEYLALKLELEKAEKLKNELERTHKFYIESKNGFCAGVTGQILVLSNYNGIPIPKLSDGENHD